MNYSLSKQLNKNVNSFLNIKYYSYLNKVFKKNATFCGWGKKKSGLAAIKLSKKHATSFILLEDGFIRSLDLGVNNSPSFSLVKDNIGIYYDATTPSNLENILNTYDFLSDKELLNNSSKAIKLILKYNISKYNHAPNISQNFFTNTHKKILVIAQTAGDSSLKYGMKDNFTTANIITTAIDENPEALIYLKIHPDVLSGKKESDIDIKSAREKCIIIEENINPISLLKQFDKVYTKTSGMGFEALLCGCECVCFGMPFYAGWGVTDDRSQCTRRTKKRNVEEIFAAAYILYTQYYNPYRKRPSDIFDTIEEILLQKNRLLAKESYDFLAIEYSHVQIFENKLFKYLWPKKRIKTIHTLETAALNPKNINSRAQIYSKHLNALKQYNYKKIIINLAGIETSDTFLNISKMQNTPIKILLKETINNYKTFLLKAIKYAQLIVISAPLPTLDNEIKHNNTNIHKNISISQQERTKFILSFNKQIKEFCIQIQDIDFIDLYPYALSKKGIPKSLILNKKNKRNYHFTYILLLIWKLKKYY